VTNKHYYAVDLESWVYPDLKEFHGLTQEERKKLDNGYIVDSTRQLLKLLKKHKTKLTFFVIGEIYDWYPELVEEIKNEGHEIAYHTHTHRLIKDKGVLQEQLNKSKEFLDKYKPMGFQAPVVYLAGNCYATLAKYGFSYSSSVYHPDISYQKTDSGLVEIPVSTYRYRGSFEKLLKWPRQMKIPLLFHELPFGSSYFTSLIGSRGMSFFLDKFNQKNKSAVLFVHNWQLFPPQKASYPNFKFLLRHPLYFPYTKNIREDFEKLLDKYEFDKLENYYKSVKNQ
jgi:hypothetical protein